MDFTNKELQLLQYAVSTLLFDIKDEQEIPILLQAERKNLKNNQRACKNLLDKIEEEMQKQNVNKDTKILTNIIEIDGEFLRGYQK